MGQRAGIEEEALEGPAGRADPVEQRPLVVRLERLDGRAELAGALREAPVDVRERLFPVDRGLSRAQELQVRAGEDEDPRRAFLAQASSASSFGAAVRIK